MAVFKVLRLSAMMFWSTSYGELGMLPQVPG